MTARPCAVAGCPLPASDADPICGLHARHAFTVAMLLGTSGADDDAETRRRERLGDVRVARHALRSAGAPVPPLDLRPLRLIAGGYRA